MYLFFLFFPLCVCVCVKSFLSRAHSAFAARFRTAGVTQRIRPARCGKVELQGGDDSQVPPPSLGDQSRGRPPHGNHFPNSAGNSQQVFFFFASPLSFLLSFSSPH